MPTITCYVAELKVPKGAVLPKDFTVGRKTIREYFQQESALPGGGAAIDLEMNDSQRYLLTVPPTFGVCDADLQSSLARLFATAKPSSSSAVGLVLADSYVKYSDAYGCMFDMDLKTSEYGPRQGCAIFLRPVLSAIEDIHGGTQEFQNFVTFTAIHELGHALNLWHVDTSSFMTPSPKADDFMEAPWFVEQERSYLQDASDPDAARYVMPGGSNFNDHGSLDAPSDSGNLMRPPAASALKLTIRLHQHEFYHFEPIELDVSLTCSGGTALKIPDRIDPSHDSFAIWITRPDGHRFRYYPGKHVCASWKLRPISHRQPFRRDITFFRHCGGPTFTAPGRYQVQAVLTVSKRRSVHSNVAVCEVIPPQPRLKTYREMKQVFSSREAIQLLRHRTKLPPARVFQALVAFAERHRSLPSAATVQYALGRAFLTQAERQPNPNRSHRARVEGLLHLRKAADRDLSDHRLSIAERLLSRSSPGDGHG
jgi:hypothetical protein